MEIEGHVLNTVYVLLMVLLSVSFFMACQKDVIALLPPNDCHE